MKFLNNTFGFLAVFCVFSASFAVTARPGIVNTASVISASGRRMPSLNQMMIQNTSAPIVAQQSGTATMDEVECVEAYTECLASEESCGLDFEECTTNVLFHAQMPDCTSTLMQCPQGAITKLFGAGAALTNLSNVASHNVDNEITRYTYPLAGSILDQKIEAARIENMYDDQTCVKRYTNCLKRDDVCGENFELCTSDRNFKKQALNCDSHLSRCAMSGVRKMFGDKVQNKSMNKKDGLIDGVMGKGLIDGVDDLSSIGGSIAILIDDGADYVALNAVSSCYKKVDSCILAACNANPLRCIEGTSLEAITSAERTVGTDMKVTSKVGAVAGESEFKKIIKAGEGEATLTISHINRYLRSMCADSIGGFEACQITYNGGNKPKKQDLADRDIIEEVFNLAHNDRKSILESKIQGLMQEFDTAAKDACRETIRTCAMRACGEGIGSACYTQVFDIDTSGKKISIAGKMSGLGSIKIASDQASINKGTPYKDIKTACAAVVNNDKNCIYAYSSNQKDGIVEYAYVQSNAFDTLFPDATSSGSDDPIGVVGELNALLATSYNKAAIEAMRKECTNTAKACVRALCGDEYESCYRNRNDIMSSITKTGNGGESFDKSMNKVGGVLDYTVIVGLCLDTVKNNNACNEHLAIAKARVKDGMAAEVATWGSADSVRGGWLDAGSASKATDTVQEKDDNGDLVCENKKGERGVCDKNDGSGKVDGIYNKPVYVTLDAFQESQADSTFFRDLVYDLEKEAQAMYNAKLTKLQNMCLTSNGGNGAMGSNELSSIYRWVKLTKDTVPQNYSNVGLESKDIKESNDLYSSFCAVKVELKSDDQTIRDALTGTLKKKKEKSYEGRYKDDGTLDLSESSYRYFAIGDPAVCGGWLTGSDLESIAEQVEANARIQAKDEQPKNLRGWMTTLGALGLGTGGIFLGDAIEKGFVGSSFTGITNTKKIGKNIQSNIKSCDKYKNNLYGKIKAKPSRTTLDQLNEYIDDARKDLNKVSELLSEVDDTNFGSAKSEFGDWEDAVVTYCNVGTDGKCQWNGTDAASDTTAARKAIEAIDCKSLTKSCPDGKEWSKADEKCVKKCNPGDDCKTEWVGKLAGGLGGAAIGGVLAYTVTDAVLDAKLDKAGNEAYQEFMDTVGSKIHCYIGTQKVASFGQIIETSMQ